MSQRRSTACGGLPPKGGETFTSLGRTTETKVGYLILTPAIKKRRCAPETDVPNSVRAGNCLSKAWIWASVQEGSQDFPGWQLEIGQSEQQHGVDA